MGTYYIKTDDESLTTSFIEHLESRGYKKSNKFPVDFIFVWGEYARYSNRFDSKKSKWISLLWGKTREYLANKVTLHKLFNESSFLLPSVFIEKGKDIPEVPNRFLKILKPTGTFKGEGITIVKNKHEIEEWIKNHPKPTEWLLQDYIKNPALKDGKKFHLRVITLVVKRDDMFEVYVFNEKIYVKAKKEYIQEDWLNVDIHDTHVIPGSRREVFPEEVPDEWTHENVKKADKDILKIIHSLFTHSIELTPEMNAKNGFYIFGADILFNRKKAILLEFNSNPGLSVSKRNVLVPGILSIILDSETTPYFTRIL